MVANLWIVLDYFAGTAVGAISRSRTPGPSSPSSFTNSAWAFMRACR